MLVATHRRVVFIHDKYIYASIANYAVLSAIIRNYVLIPRSKKELHRDISTVEIILGSRDPIEMLGKGFYEKLDEYSSVELIDFVDRVKLYPSMEYAVRSYSRSKLVDLIELGLVWIIPFNSISGVHRRKRGSEEILEIEYECLLTNKKRAFAMRYSDEVYRVIKQLCAFNENPSCS